MRCTKCGAENREGAKFCSDCAAPLAAHCPACAAVNKPGAKFCDECGAAMSASIATSSRRATTCASRSFASEDPGAQLPEGERKTVTALFADIKGSMELMEDLDPEEARAIVDPALRLMIDAVHRYDGYIVQSTGDGIFALFGAPVAHEDHPQRALYAALRMQEDLRRYAEIAPGRKSSRAGAGRRQHRRGRGAFDSDRRRARGVHPDRPFHRPGGAAADAGQSRRGGRSAKACGGWPRVTFN